MLFRYSSRSGAPAPVAGAEGLLRAAGDFFETEVLEAAFFFASAGAAPEELFLVVAEGLAAADFLPDDERFEAGVEDFFAPEDFLLEGSFLAILRQAL